MNQKNSCFYDAEEAIGLLCDYFDKCDKNIICKLPFKKLYKDAQDFINENYEFKMPSFSQIRNYILAMLNEYDLISDGENLTSSVAYRLMKIYMNSSSYYIQNNNIEIFEENIILFVLALPESDIIRQMILGINKEKKKKEKKISRRILINTLCKKIKKQNEKVVIAAISEANLFITNNNYFKERENNPYFSCSSICLFVVNNEKGREFVCSITKENAILNYL